MYRTVYCTHPMNRCIENIFFACYFINSTFHLGVYSMYVSICARLHTHTHTRVRAFLWMRFYACVIIYNHHHLIKSDSVLQFQSHTCCICMDVCKWKIYLCMFEHVAHTNSLTDWIFMPND